MTKADVERIFSNKYPTGSIQFVDNKFLVTFAENGKCYTYQKIAYADLLTNLKCNNYIYNHDFNSYISQLVDLQNCKNNGYMYEDDDTGFGTSKANPEIVNFEINKISKIIEDVKNGKIIIA